MAIFNSYVKLPEGTPPLVITSENLGCGMAEEARQTGSPDSRQLAAWHVLR